MSIQNRRILLKRRPTGEPTHEDFEVSVVEVPKITDGQVLLKTIYNSLDPYMRGRMDAGGSYAEDVKLGQVMISSSVSKVVESKNEKYKVGDWVLSGSGWQDYSVIEDNSKGEFGIVNLGQNPKNPSYALGILGMPGFTAYMGLLDIGNPKPGETVVVGAATGPVGSIVGQIAKIKGCRVVGIAGGKKKCEYAVSEFGFDACVDHSNPNLPELLKQACPNGIDVYFENVGGKLLEAVMPLLNTKARIPVCGVVSMYNSTGHQPGPNLLPSFEVQILFKRLRVEGFIIFSDYGHRFDEFYQATGKWLEEGKLKYLEQVVDGFDKTIDHFIGMLKGENFGKLVMKYN